MSKIEVLELSKVLEYKDGKLYWRMRSPDMFEDGPRDKEWRCKNWNSRNSGKEAFTANLSGYKVGRLNKRNYLAHVIVWALLKGYWPRQQIDHINGDKADNRIENLREVTCSENSKNCKMRADNTSGSVGVYKNNKLGKWEVRAHNKYFGLYNSFEEAKLARKQIEKDHDYHPNHGRKQYA